MNLARLAQVTGTAASFDEWQDLIEQASDPRAIFNRIWRVGTEALRYIADRETDDLPFAYIAAAISRSIGVPVAPRVIADMSFAYAFQERDLRVALEIVAP